MAWTRLLLFPAALTAVLAAHPGLARPPGFHSKPGPLAAALTELGRDAAVSLLFAPGDVSDRQTSGIKGQPTVEAALERLLKGSGLTYERTPGGSYLIHRAAQVSAAQQALPDIVVVGRRTQNADIRRTQNDIQPYRVATARAIVASHTDNADEFLRTRETGNTTTASAAQMPAATFASTRSNIDLHGLGFEQTLVLIDGLRMPGLPSASTAFFQPDLNAIPVERIDRIETLTATAGGIYGPGATGGVVNVVLKRDYRGADLTLDTSLPEGGGGARRRVDARFGFTPDGGATDVMVAVGHQVLSDLTAGERKLTERANELAIRNNPALYVENFGTSDAVLVSGTNLRLTSAYGGASLGADVTYLPIGSSGTPASVAAQLVKNAGTLPPALSSDANGRNGNLLSASSTTSVLASIRHRFSPSIEAFVDLVHLENDGHATAPAQYQNGTLLAGAPNNPFNQSVTITFPLPGVGFALANRVRQTRATAGLLASLPGGWHADASVGIGRASMTEDEIGTALDIQNFTPALGLGGAMASGLPIPAPLGDWQSFLDAVLAYRLPETQHVALTNHSTDTNLRLAGPIIRIAGGDITATLLLEHRREEIPSSIAVIVSPTLGPNLSQEPLPNVIDSVDSAYGEARVPLVSFDTASPFRGLELQGAVRFDHSRIDAPAFFDASTGVGEQGTGRYNTVSYTAGLRMFPLKWLMLRASVATGGLPPSPGEIGTGRFQSVIQDPARNDRYAVIEVLAGGSTKLIAANGRTIAAGVVLNPNGGRWPRLSIDYERLDLSHEISSAYGLNYYLAHPDAFPDRIQRAPLTDADRAAGFSVGEIQQIDTTAMNIGRARVQAVDAALDWTMRFGLNAVRFHGAATWEPEVSQQASPDAPSVETVGYNGGPLEWRANGGIEWTGRGFGLGIDGQYYAGYKVQDLANDLIYIPDLQGSPIIPAQLYFDLDASWHLPLHGRVGPLRDAILRFGVSNVLNHAPPTVVGQFGGPGYSFYGDPRLRRISLSLTSRL
ncbi:TonB-dependent receptor [Sphingomonas sp. UYP23]